MAVSNSTIGELLRRYAAIIALQERADNKFKVKAYRRAAATIEGLQDNIAKRVVRGDTLTTLPGIGSAIAQIIEEIVQTGTLARLELAEDALPTSAVELVAWPGLNAKTVARIYKKLDIGSLSELKNALASGAILQALGPKIADHVRRGLDPRPRHLLWDALKVAGPIEQFLRTRPGVKLLSPSGSLRRRQDTVGDLNYVVSGKSAAAIFDEFSKFGAVKSSERHGRSESRFQLSSGLMAGLRWTPANRWGQALMEATGTAAHLFELEVHAAKVGLVLNRQALWGTVSELTLGPA